MNEPIRCSRGVKSVDGGSVAMRVKPVSSLPTQDSLPRFAIAGAPSKESPDVAGRLPRIGIEALMAGS